MDSISPEALQNAQPGAGPSDDEQAKRAADEQQMRRDMLATILDVGARERCAYPRSPTECSATACSRWAS